MSKKDEFLFALTNPGLEKFLKEEIKLKYPHFHPSYSRQGFITFKNTSPKLSLTPKTSLDLVFCRSYGVSLFHTKTTHQLEAQLGLLVQQLKEKGQRIHLQQWSPSGGAMDFGQIKSMRENDALVFDELPLSGELVLSIFVLSEKEYWVGLHAHEEGRLPWPGGVPQVDLPPEAPSRAYLKMVEGLLWSNAPIKPGQWALDIGCAPGGMSYALLQKGLNVVGVDRAQVDPVCLNFKRKPQFVHLNIPIQKLEASHLPGPIHWITMDLNLRPGEALSYLKKAVTLAGPSFRGALIVLKVSDPQYVKEIPHWLRLAQSMVPTQVRATLLPSNRQEFFLYLENLLVPDHAV